jgi:hypothetical protein
MEEEAVEMTTPSVSVSAPSLAVRRQRTATEVERVKLLATTDREWPMYVQSVLVWNIPSHLAVLLLGGHLLISWGEVLVRRLGLFQLVGAALIVWGVVSMWRAHAARKAEKKRSKEASTHALVAAAPKEQLEKGLFWPQDAAGMSAESYSLSAKTFTTRVKLLKHEELIERYVEVRQSMRRALYALHILRYSNPTQFALNICFVCLLGAVVGSFFSGKTLLLAVLYSLLLGPGLARRHVFTKLRRMLQLRIGRGWVEWLLVSNYLNLEETNTAKVVAFVRSADSAEPLKPKVTTKAIA